MALIIVIWVVTALFALFAVYGERLVAEIWAVSREAGRAEAEELARLGFETAIQRLLADETGWDSPDEKWAGRYGAELPGGRWRVEVADEGSRVNINSFGAAVLSKLPGLDEESLVALLDWRDLDDEPRTGGAERGYYASLAPPYEPRNGRYEVPEELTLVRGLAEAFPKLRGLVTTWGPLNVHVMDPDAFEALLLGRGVGQTAAQFIKRDLLVHRSMSPGPPASLEAFREALATFTHSDLEKVASDLTVDGTINVNTAQPEVLRLLMAGLGIGSEVQDRLLEARRTIIFTSVPQLAVALGDEAAYQKMLGYLTVRSRVFGITATGLSRDGQQARFLAVVRRERSGEPGSPWSIDVLSWQWLGREE